MLRHHFKGSIVTVNDGHTTVAEECFAAPGGATLIFETELLGINGQMADS